MKNSGDFRTYHKIACTHLSEVAGMVVLKQEVHEMRASRARETNIHEGDDGQK